ncbi:Nn.00g032510.m01.CDS01 [Neocucurbitaria sp. VM-36]
MERFAYDRVAVHEQESIHPGIELTALKSTSQEDEGLLPTNVEKSEVSADISDRQDLEAGSDRRKTGWYSSIVDALHHKSGGTPWRLGLYVGFYSSLLVLVGNISILLVGCFSHGLSSGAIRTIAQGSSGGVRSLSIFYHIVINLFSTILLASSNYAMQILSAPSRDEIDMAHRNDWGLSSTLVISATDKYNGGRWILLNAFVANVPQVFLSLSYFGINRLCTSMCTVIEWNKFALQKKSLRTSTPQGGQRLTHYLQIPFRFPVPLLVITGVLHWLMSQSLFLIRLDVRPVPGVDTAVSRSACGYSVISQCCFIGLYSAVLAVVLSRQSKHLMICIPPAEHRSTNISDACHPPLEDTEAHLREVKWGVVRNKSDTFNYCTFTDLDVEAPEEGKEYTWTPMDVLLQGLNDAQKDAVTSPSHVVQVLAPPGSGKTKTLTARVAYYINHERLQPWNIIVCTFTIKAAREMKERIKGFVGEKLEAKLILGTFHSVARRFLSRYGHEIGIDKNFGIADTDDSKAIIKRIVTRYQYTVEPGHARSRISGLKAKGTSAESYAATTKNVNDNEFAQVYSSYQEHLKASNLLDYDDLLVRCVELLQRHPSCVSTIQAVLIDEYQDTNNIQYELMKLLAQQTRRITIVGDPDQSIYSFRSAEIQNLYRMRKEFPESVVINLENNYRSSGCILGAALAVIEQDESRPEKALIATHCVGEQPTLRHLATVNVEAKWIVDEIQRSKTLTAGLLTYNDYAILVRSANLSLSIERELGRAGIPYRMVGGKRFFDRAEIKIILNYLRCISNPDNNDAIVGVINTPSRKVGDKTVKGLLEEAEVQKVSLWRLVCDIAQKRKTPATKLSSPSEQGITLFFRLINNARKKLLPTAGEPCNLLDLISYILTQTSFEAFLKQSYKENWKDRWANVEELVGQATQMATALAEGEEVADDALPAVEGIEQRPDTAVDTLSKFLVNVALATEVERNDGEELSQVTISTIHAAKGLEWPVVFVPAVYDGSLPHSRAENHDEERRLLYVGMTRAQALLYLSCPVRQSGQEQTTLSKFVSSRSIQKYFSERGPDLAFKRSTIPDLATILRRPCPALTDIEAARKLLERLEDDKYPATRDEIDGVDPSWGASWNDGVSGSGPGDNDMQPSFKRRRIETSSTAPSDTVSVTMHKSSGFSTASTTMQTVKAGFTSARDLGDLQAMQQEAERIRMLATARSAEAGKTAYNAAQKVDAKPGRTKTLKPRATGQGAITSFFKRSGSTLSDEADYNSSSSILSGHVPLHDISNVQRSAPQPYHPLSISTTTTHKLQTRPILSKPKRSDPDPSIETTRYVLLSSSPAKPEPEDTTTTSLTTNKGDDVADPESAVRKPSSSSKVQSQAAQRKTLGTRRTMQGWSVKHSQMPKPRPS